MYIYFYPVCENVVSYLRIFFFAQVEHFSKYGLDESDDEESEEMNVRKPKKVVVPKVTEKFGDPKKIFSHKVI